MHDYAWRHIPKQQSLSIWWPEACIEYIPMHLALLYTVWHPRSQMFLWKQDVTVRSGVGIDEPKNNAGRLLRFERKHDLYLHAGKGQYNPRVEFCCAKRAAHVEFCGEITDNQDTMQTRWRTHVLIRKNHQICPHLQKCSSSGHQVHPKVNYHETRQVMSRESFSKRRCRCQHEKRFKPHFDEV